MGSAARESSQERFEQELAKALKLSNLSYECEEKARWEECSPLALPPMQQPALERQRPNLSTVSTSGGSAASATEEDDEELQHALSKWREEVGDDHELLMALRESVKEQAREQQKLLDVIRADASSSEPTTTTLALPALLPLEGLDSEDGAVQRRGGEVEEGREAWHVATDSAGVQDALSLALMASDPEPPTGQPDPEPGQRDAAPANPDAAPAHGEGDDDLQRAIKASLEVAAEDEDELTAAINASLKDQEEEQERVWNQIKREASLAGASSSIMPPLPEPSAPAWCDLADAEDCEEDVAAALESGCQIEERVEADDGSEHLSLADTCAAAAAAADDVFPGTIPAEESCSLRWARIIQAAQMVQDVSADVECNDKRAPESQEEEDALPLAIAASYSSSALPPPTKPAVIATDMPDDVQESGKAQAVPPVAVIDMTSKVLRVLVGDDDDAWRMKVSWPSDANSCEIVIAIRKAIHDCSGIIDDAEEFYFRSSPGELVLLDEDSVHDFLSSAAVGPGAVLNLMASVVANSIQSQQQKQQHEEVKEVEEVKEEKKEDAPAPEDSEEEWQVVDVVEEA